MAAAAPAVQPDPKPRLRFDYTINVGTVLHLAGVVLAVFFAWHEIDLQLTTQRQHLMTLTTAVQQLQVQNRRVELYLATRDQKYWQAVSQIPPSSSLPSLPDKDK